MNQDQDWPLYGPFMVREAYTYYDSCILSLGTTRCLPGAPCLEIGELTILRHPMASLNT